MHPVVRLYSHTEWEGDCLVWTGSRTEHGYARFYYQGHIVPAHRWVFMYFNGPLPPDVLVRHFVCDNPPCVYLPHLRAGTHTENARDRMEHGRDGHLKRTHCIHDHEYTEVNTFVRKDGARICRECERIRQRKVQV